MPTGIKIREIRKRKGFTQKQLGEKCNIAESTIRRYESGSLNPKIETLQKIAGALGCDILDLMEIEVEPITTDKMANLLNISVGSLTNDNEITNKTQPSTLAAHFDGDEFTDEELEEIKNFVNYVKSKRGFKATDMFKDVGKMSSDLIDKK